MITPEMSSASPAMKRYTSLNSKPGMKSRVSVHRSARKVEKGSLADVICGHVFHKAVKKAAIPIRQSIKLRAYADFWVRRIFFI
jgi:hypothetical protein